MTNRLLSQKAAEIPQTAALLPFKTRADDLCSAIAVRAYDPGCVVAFSNCSQTTARQSRYKPDRLAHLRQVTETR